MMLEDEEEQQEGEQEGIQEVIRDRESAEDIIARHEKAGLDPKDLAKLASKTLAKFLKDQEELNDVADYLKERKEALQNFHPGDEMVTNDQ